MNQVKLNDLPDLPFELILSYLSLEDRIKARPVSRRWYNVINRFRPTIFCYSKLPRGFIYQNSRLISDVFVQNFISSPWFETFFRTFGQSIFSNLKHLRLCNLFLSAKNGPGSFYETLNSFDQLEKLDLLRIYRTPAIDGDFQLHLNLPMLKSFYIEVFVAITGLTLDAPRLQKVKHVDWPKVDLVHGESVEKLVIDRLDKMEVKKMKNLKYLYFGSNSSIDPTLLSSLEQLEEIHLYDRDRVANLFEQKQRYGHLNLKIFLCGCLLNGPSDPLIDSLRNREYPRSDLDLDLAENKLRLAEEIPLWSDLSYDSVEAVTEGQEIKLLKRFTDLKEITLPEPVQNVDRFLKLLKNLNHIVALRFVSDQPQELYDRLPDHCAVQRLEITKAPEDLNFLFKLKSLIYLVFLRVSIDIDIVQKVWNDLPFIHSFYFDYLNTFFGIQNFYFNRFSVWIDGQTDVDVSNAKAAIQWVIEKARELKEG